MSSDPEQRCPPRTPMKVIGALQAGPPTRPDPSLIDRMVSADIKGDIAIIESILEIPALSLRTYAYSDCLLLQAEAPL